MKQSQFDNQKLNAKLAILKEKRKQRNDMRKTIQKMDFVNISEYSRVTGPSTKDITAPVTPKETDSFIIQKPSTPAMSTSGLSYDAISKLSFL